jgi:hypothetical protein
MMGESLRSHMPALYRSWLPPFFDRPALVEARATCADCAMCARSELDEAAPEAGFFRPDVKCCSYHPTLPNYLVGAALQDTTPELEAGRATLRAKIAARVGVTPAWLSAPRKLLVLYEASRESSFGRSDAILCPYFERASGNCTVWAYRESVCATFFCKHVAGAAGHAFWSALRRYLAHVEAALARYAATSICGVKTTPELPRTKLTREDLEDRPPSPASYADSWGVAVGHEAEVYVECANLVANLGRDELTRIIDDAGGRELLMEMERRYDAVVQPQLATRLTLNPELRVSPAQGGVNVTSYSRYDPLFISQDLYDALAQFVSTETVESVIERLRREHEVDLPAALLLEMQLHGVMTPSSS